MPASHRRHHSSTSDERYAERSRCCDWLPFLLYSARRLSRSGKLKVNETSTKVNPKIFAVVICGLAFVLLLGSSIRLPGGAQPRSSTPIPAALRTIPGTDVNPYGANFYLHREVEPWKVEKTLQMAKEAGIGWVKQHFPWEDIESSKGKYLDANQKSTWSKFDLIVDLAEKYGLQIIARLDRPPAWTRRDNSLREAPPDNFEDYGDFVRAVVTRYKGRIHYYQLWNEPNIYPEWGNQPVDPAAYVRLLKVGYRAAKEVDPNVYVLSAPLAQTLEKSPMNLSDLDYLEQMYRNGAADYFDILFANAYGFDLPPEDPPNPDVLNFSRFVLLHDIMEKYGDGDKPVWFNEFGWNAASGDMDPQTLKWGRVSEEEQADYTVRAIEMARSKWDWVGVFCIWYFRQDGHIRPESPEYYFRMVDPGFTPRLVYQAVKKASKDLTVAVKGAYQETNPAVEYRGSWQPVQESRASGGAMMVTHQAEDNATITFSGTSVSIVVAKGPSSGRIYVTLDGREAGLLPTDNQGRSYIDLYAAAPEWQVEIPVAERLYPGEHKLRLVVAAGLQVSNSAVGCALDGFIVGGGAGVGAIEMILPAVGVAIVLVGALGGFLWRRRGRRGAALQPD